MDIPVLMITYNRLEYTKRAVSALLQSENCLPFIIDNGSTDGTKEWLYTVVNSQYVIHNSTNLGIAGAMNQFLNLIPDHPYFGKVDNDTIVPADWITKMLPALDHCDIVQAKHHIIPATHPGGWEGFTSRMLLSHGSLLFNHFVGGSGILCKRPLIDHIPETDWVLGGWRKFQLDNPQLIKAFTTKVEIRLLDEHGYSDYPEYYKQTGRI